jgi:CRISP-associated protein Cas1
MKQHLNTLFVTTQGAYVHCEGEAALIRIEKETRLRVPLHMIGGVVCFGQVSCSPAFMGRCGERGVTITHLTEYGRFLAFCLCCFYSPFAQMGFQRIG